jgi:hypothetical protein
LPFLGAPISRLALLISPLATRQQPTIHRPVEINSNTYLVIDMTGYI